MQENCQFLGDLRVFCILSEIIFGSIKIKYSQVEAAVSLAGVDISPPEIHGVVVGALCNHLKSGQKPDLAKLLLGKDQSSNVSAFVDMAHELYRESADVLLDGEAEFKLLLIDEEDSLDLRTESLAQWCRGYILGLLSNEAFSIDQLSDEIAEIVRDIMAISEAEAGNDDDTDEDWALAELEEYVKVGVQLVFEIIYSERVTEAPNVTQ